MPAMIGLVEPAMGAEAMAGDCRALAGMILTWLRPNRVAALHVRIKPMFEALRAQARRRGRSTSRRTTPTIDELMALISDALALVDFNFSVLRDSGGDLQEYALLLISLRLYHLLWPSVPASAARPTPAAGQVTAPRLAGGGAGSRSIAVALVAAGFAIAFRGSARARSVELLGGDGIVAMIAAAPWWERLALPAVGGLARRPGRARVAARVREGAGRRLRDGGDRARPRRGCR